MVSFLFLSSSTIAPTRKGNCNSNCSGAPTTHSNTATRQATAGRPVLTPGGCTSWPPAAEAKTHNALACHHSQAALQSSLVDAPVADVVKVLWFVSRAITHMFPVPVSGAPAAGSGVGGSGFVHLFEEVGGMGWL